MVGMFIDVPTEPIPIRRRRRAQLLPARGNGSPCVLEETVPCTFESPTPCDSLCRHSEWSQWSECTEKSLDFGVIPVTASSREKHVFAESGEACFAHKLREFDSSRCTAASPAKLEARATYIAVEEDPFLRDVSFSCLSNGRWPQRYRLSLRTDAKGKQPAYEDTINEDCPGFFEPCRKDRDPSCDGIWPQHDVPENQRFCRQSCKAILKSCEEEAKLSGTTALQCLVTNILNNQTLRGKCVLSPELEKGQQVDCAKTCHDLETYLVLYADDVGLDCERTTPKLSSVSPEDCKAKCLDIKQTCSQSSASFLPCVATKRQTTRFDEECAAQANVIAGRGIVFCKLIPRNCEYSEWGEWSECSSTCRRGPGATANSIRVRSRQIVQPSSTGGEPCKFGSPSKDLDQASSLSFTPKPEPSLQPWSSNTTTTTTTEPTVDPAQRVTCNIVDMSSAKTDLGYDTGVRISRHA
ncbi:hypothetical protein Emag_000982 [Eimeria magna]